jgi:hypothetical protein
MASPVRIAFAEALLLVGTSVVSAKIRVAAGAHDRAIHPTVNATMPRATVPDPYYRLSDAYYGDTDPYNGLFDFYALPPYSPGGAYRHVRPIGGR